MKRNYPWKTQWIKKNKYTRPGMKNNGVKAIIMHYTADPGATAQNIRDYFNGTCIASKRYASAHDAVDPKGVIHYIPYGEVAYHAHDNNRQLLSHSRYGDNMNFSSIGIELCINKSGKLESTTYNHAVNHVAYLCNFYKLDPSEHIFRHYDVTKKNCPAFWVTDPKGFEQFKEDVAKVLNKKSDYNDDNEYYTVQKGDTVSNIAKQYGTSIQQIKSWNKLNDDYLIKPGQKLRVK